MKPGDKVLVRATLEWCSANELVCRARTERSDFTFNGHEAIPDSPALPAVARWLAEHPEAVADVTRMLIHLESFGYPDDGDRESLQSLIAALTEATR